MEILLTSHQLAKIINVWPETLRRWEREGKLVPLRTPGGHRRYKESQIKTLLGEKQVKLAKVIEREVTASENNSGGDDPGINY